ncbi:FCD domain-containing protein [Rhodospirillum rubrum]|uniref:Pyruvate dehydrogenase complex repressor n=1 Tax=Rhodospirillum rubrum (strain ATCC 11170 / ATH 1.1.1 / DSM 467 / LMG 4362 / NCIMB 8255 / S1) TaxID=269796 RepID=Q2RUI0_RHORT|nr:FCD domain-containing protein [Rhodospirillum rubrum]ABC22215.1 transcriptional regulator, GntR family [Rhodospirillum rubrum ATCC 11170]AEO47931.1 GntR family transcriptional regulator [Rhodospirillum rubrum F11]MBK5952871.1 GntR family transcriptional regulator [Rhodospirillum rubrum]QXG81859.1 FCD domain-containing protein [Rhodospirillum rubrum]
MIMSEPIRATRLAETIADHLERLIAEGALRPGERLLPERELALKLNVSRPSLRDGLAAMERRGLIVTDRQGSRVAEFLRPLTEPLELLIQNNTQATFDYLEFRFVVEGAAAEMAAKRATDLDRAAIRAILDRMAAVHGDDDSAAEAEADADLHSATYEATYNVMILHIMRGFSQLLRRDVFYNRERLYARPGVRDLLLGHHQAIGEAIIAGDGPAARRAAEEHITVTRETLEEIRDADARLAMSLRRIGRRDLVAPER